jgi:hypothetical protein
VPTNYAEEQIAARKPGANGQVMADIVVLGAEAQAATSIACAYPERTITFASNEEILDGTDLPNVRMVFAKPQDWERLCHTAVQTVPLCPRWLLPHAAISLSRVFERLERCSPGLMLPIFDRPTAKGRWIIKGDRWHRPDAPVSGSLQQLEDVADPHGCGLVYQPLCKITRTIMAIGRRGYGTQLGCVRIFDERFFWDNILQAGETVDDPDVTAATLQVLDAIDHQGFFTLNWLRTEYGLKLSSLRPIPRAVFQMFRCGGVNLLNDVPGVKVVRAGLQMIAAPTYVSYRKLTQ